ncbi:MAG: hypothetical protein L0099_13120 [Acidobacteria bacterium]|nr:hypothetical protein [Acidobacteriota bacterium]
MHPVATAILIVFFVALAGVAYVAVRKHRSLSGYEEVAMDTRALAKLLKGEFFRDGGDLVISGHFGDLPTVIRFSRDENTPGLNIRMRAQATFTLSVVPKGARATEGRVLVKTSDEMFDARYNTRTDHPTQARMMLGSKKVIQHLAKLVCSSNTFFTISTGNLELSELVIPELNTGGHISDHLKSLARVAQEVAAMPGAEKIKVEKIKEPVNVPLRVAVAVGVLAAGFAVYGAMQSPPAVRATDAGAVVPEGVPPVDVPLLQGIVGPLPDGRARYRLASGEDFAPAGVSWLRNNRVTASGRVEGDFSGTGGGRDAGYILISNEDGARRVALIANGVNRYDATFPGIALAARVRKGVVGAIQWVGQAPGTPDGDGLLIVRDASDRASGLVLFVKGNQLISAAPQDYQLIIIE